LIFPLTRASSWSRMLTVTLILATYETLYPLSPEGAAHLRQARKIAEWKGRPQAGLHKRSAEDWGHSLSRARDGVPQEAWLRCFARSAERRSGMQLGRALRQGTGMLQGMADNAKHNFL
jgi:hypothetical protein